MPAIWAAIEADFLREYGVRLGSELDRISWRAFSVLFSGLPPDGAVARRLLAQLQPSDRCADFGSLVKG